MHRVALKHGSIVAAAGRANPVRGWSVLSRPCAQVCTWQVGHAGAVTSHVLHGFRGAGRDNPSTCCAPRCSSFERLFHLVISRGSFLVSQRALSNGRDSAGGREDGGDSGRKIAPTGGNEGVGGAARTRAGANQPAGRGRGAFSQYLRTHEVSQHLEPPAPLVHQHLHSVYTCSAYECLLSLSDMFIHPAQVLWHAPVCRILTHKG